MRKGTGLGQESSAIKRAASAHAPMSTGSEGVADVYCAHCDEARVVAQTAAASCAHVMLPAQFQYYGQAGEQCGRGRRRAPPLFAWACLVKVDEQLRRVEGPRGDLLCQPGTRAVCVGPHKVHGHVRSHACGPEGGLEWRHRVGKQLLNGAQHAREAQARLVDDLRSKQQRCKRGGAA